MPGPSTHTQKTKDALAYFLGGAQAATLCNIRSAGRSASKEELVAAYNCLFDALTPVLEASNDLRLRRKASGAADPMADVVQHPEFTAAGTESSSVRHE